MTTGFLFPAKIPFPAINASSGDVILRAHPEKRSDALRVEFASPFAFRSQRISARKAQASPSGIVRPHNARYALVADPTSLASVPARPILSRRDEICGRCSSVIFHPRRRAYNRSFHMARGRLSACRLGFPDNQLLTGDDEIGKLTLAFEANSWGGKGTASNFAVIGDSNRQTKAVATLPRTTNCA